MMDKFAPAAFGLTNGILPILALVLLTVWLPTTLAGWVGNRQGRLALVMLMVAVDLILIGAALLGFLTANEDATARAAPLDLLERSPRLAMAWGPVWLLVWVMRAQGIERRKGLAMDRGGQDAGDV